MIPGVGFCVAGPALAFGWFECVDRLQNIW